MRHLPWFRLYAEARTDAKLRSLPDDQFRVWFNLLCYAADQDDGRGTVDISDPFIVALEVAGGDEELLSRTCHALSRLRIIEERDSVVTFINFVQRQYDKPSDTPDQTRERKRKQRATTRNSDTVTHVSRDVTPSHAQEEKRVEERRVEERRQETDTRVAARVSSEPFEALLALCDATGADVSELSESVKGKQLGKAKQLLAAGMPVADIGRCARYCASQSWRSGSVDMFTVEKERGKWEMAGKPSAEQAKPVNGRASPQMTNAELSVAAIRRAAGKQAPEPSGPVFETTGRIQR